jgi:hypothetical protein
MRVAWHEVPGMAQKKQGRQTAIKNPGSQPCRAIVFDLLAHPIVSWEVEMQQHERFAAEPFDFAVIRGRLQSAPRLEIGFGAGPTRFGCTSILLKSVIGQAPSKMCD